jgi:signal transduction histidine kinase
VTGDFDRLQQVVINLLANAIKFTPDNGQVAIGLQAGDDATAEIIVRDHGVGIKREFLPYVFDRFRQSDAPPGFPNNGLGLGLSIVREIVERHGGSVIAESEGEGHGATFRVVLPLVTRAHASHPAQLLHTPARHEFVEKLGQPRSDDTPHSVTRTQTPD